MLWRHTSTGLPAAHQHQCPTRRPWDLEQLELLTENAPDDRLVIRARFRCIKRNPHSWIDQKFEVGLEKLICWGKWRFFSKLWWCCLMDFTMDASNTFYGIVYLIWFHWIYCFYPWKNIFPGKQHLSLIDILQLSESPVIFLPSITPETCPVAVTLDSTQISLNPARWNLPRMKNDLQLHWGL